MPTRSSDIERQRVEYGGQLVERADRDGARRRIVEVAPRPAAHVYADEAGRERGPHVVVDAVANVGDLGRLVPDLVQDPREELRPRLGDAPARGRADDVDAVAEQVLGRERRVAD